MPENVLKIAKPPDFDFARTVFSHGWYDLPPFALDRENWILDRVFSLGNRAPVFARIKDAGADVEIFVEAAIDQQSETQIVRDARRVLQLDADFTEFYELMKTDHDFAWIARTKAGRLLRSPTVFEDLVKSICTTNCTWALTKIMTANLVQKLGETIAGAERRGFPAAETMAAQSVEFFKNEIRAGYRSAYLHELAVRVANGELDVESWATADLPANELKKQIKQVKGVGDYAAENLLKLLGRYDVFALDTMLRGGFARKHNAGEKSDDKQIHRFYERFGAWRGLALWCDMTKDWL